MSRRGWGGVRFRAFWSGVAPRVATGAGAVHNVKKLN